MPDLPYVSLPLKIEDPMSIQINKKPYELRKNLEKAIELFLSFILKRLNKEY